MRYYISPRKTTELSWCSESPSLGNMINHLLNIACLEKVIYTKKLLWVKLSEKVNMVKAILPQDNYPVPSREAEFLSSVEKLHRDNLSGFEGKIKGNTMLHYANSIRKDKSYLPKLTHLYNNETLGGLRGDNPYAYREPVLVDLNSYTFPALHSNAGRTNYLRCALVKAIGKWRGPALIVSKQYCTSTGRITNVLKKLDSLSKRSKNYPYLKIDRNLYRDFILDPSMYLAAYQKLKSKPGSMTPGITPTTLDGIFMNEIMNIIELLRSEKFKFTPGRRINIPKSSGKTSGITIGNPRDKLVQEVVRLVLEAIYEPLFLPCSHGFRAKFSCHTALKDIFTKFTGNTWWIEGDFESCFDSIDHNKLMGLLSMKIGDQRFLQLIRKTLNAGYFEFKVHKTNFIGTPQGNIISPILANIYLHELDKYIIKLKTEFDSKVPRNRRTSEYWSAGYRLRKAKGVNEDPKRIKFLIKELQNSQSKRLDETTNRLMYVRYADDWVIAVNGSYAATVDILKKVTGFCVEHGLLLSSMKTKITNSYKEYINFLGTRIKHSGVRTWSIHKHGYKQRNRIPLLLTAPMNKIKNKLSITGFVKNNRGVTRTTWLPLTLRQIIHNYNRILRGYDNYYSFIINRGKVMSWLYYVLRDSAARTIAHKLNLGRRVKVYKKYGMNLLIKDYEKRQKDSKPVEIIKLHKPDFKINAWDFKLGKVVHDLGPFFSNTISLANLDNLKCSMCSSTYRIEMHHVRMMKDLSPRTKALDKLMARANRKQIPLCRKCHMNYHAGDIVITATRSIEDLGE